MRVDADRLCFYAGFLGWPRKISRFVRPKLLLAAATIVTVASAVKHYGSEEAVRQGLAWIAQFGPLAPIAFIVAYVIAAMLFVPGAILTISAGVLFGLLNGIVYVSVGATLGATGAFLLGRYMARDWVARKLSGNRKFKAIDRAVAHEGWKIVGLARLSPVFPFNLLNYAFGLTDIPLKDYFIASWAGMLPGIAMYVYIGTLASDLARAGTGNTRSSPAHWAFEILGLVATAVVVIYVTYVARKALSQKDRL
jgi:uncharacterized membrane protein YdjX (TVP38/TMEM64 family)